MTRFEGALRRAEASLDLPGPARARIVAEIAADLEALYATYRARGLPDDAAAARASAALGLSAESGDALTRLHQPIARRWLMRLTSSRRSAVERGAVTALTLALVGAGALGLLRADLLRDASPVVVPLLVLGAACVGIAAHVGYVLFMRQEAAGRPALAVLGGAAVVATALALTAVVIELQRTAGDVIAAGSDAALVLAPGLRRAAQAASLGITVALAALLAWFHLRSRLIVLERAEADVADAIGSKGDRP